MRGIFAVFLLLLLLYSNMEGYQLLKTGALYTHFTSHIDKDEQASFFSLLQQHYTDNESEQNDTDQDDDRQLPFKTFTASAISVLFFPAEPYRIQTKAFYPEKLFPGFRDTFFISRALGSVFRPPAVIC